MFCYFSILFSLKFFGKTGIYVYVAIAIILANIQVLKVVDRAYIIEAGSLKMGGTSSELLGSSEVQKAYLGMWGKDGWISRFIIWRN